MVSKNVLHRCMYIIYIYTWVCLIIFHKAISWINVMLRVFPLYMQYRWNNMLFCSNWIHFTSCTFFNKDTVDELPVRQLKYWTGNFLWVVSVTFYPHMLCPYDSRPETRNLQTAKKHWRRSVNSWVPGWNSTQETDWNLIKIHWKSPKY